MIFSSLPGESFFKSDIIPSSADSKWTGSTIRDISPDVSVIMITGTISPEDYAQAEKLLQGGCRLSSGQYAIISSEDWHPDFTSLLEYSALKVVILAGIHPAALDIQALFRWNSPNHFRDIIIIPTASMELLRNDAALKKNLWEQALMPVFHSAQ